jgi:hypothetical protein
MDRHCCAFARIAHGQNTTDFFAALVQRKFATAYTCAHKRARIFHLQHRALYDAIGEPHSRFRKPTPIGVAIERMMLLDAVLISSGVSWLASERDKLAHFCGLLRARLDQEEFPHITFGNGVRTCVRYFPDKLPIGVVGQGREHIFGYLSRVPRPWTSERSSCAMPNCSERSVVGRCACGSLATFAKPGPPNSGHGSRSLRILFAHPPPTS